MISILVKNSWFLVGKKIFELVKPMLYKFIGTSINNISDSVSAVIDMVSISQILTVESLLQEASNRGPSCLLHDIPFTLDL